MPSRQRSRPVRRESASTARLIVGLLLVLGTLFLAAYTVATG
ncbi:hypothetical protein [Actinoplanes sp. NPDC048796]